MNNVGGNILKKNQSAWAIFSILNNAKIQSRPAIAWRFVSGKKITTDIFIRVIRKSRNEILVRGSDMESQKILSQLVAGSETINIFLPEDMVLFQSEIRAFDANGDTVLKIPSMIAQIDRRKHMRLFINEDHSAKIKFFKQTHAQRGNTQKFEKACFDISAGGLSFIVSRMESKFFMIGDDLGIIRVAFENQEIQVVGKIVNILDVEPDARNGLHYKGKKVCVRYEKVDSKAQKKLADFVFRHADLSEAV